MGAAVSGRSNVERATLVPVPTHADIHDAHSYCLRPYSWQKERLTNGKNRTNDPVSVDSVVLLAVMCHRRPLRDLPRICHAFIYACIFVAPARFLHHSDTCQGEGTP